MADEKDSNSGEASPFSTDKQNDLFGDNAIGKKHSGGKGALDISETKIDIKTLTMNH